MPPRVNYPPASRSSTRISSKPESQSNREDNPADSEPIERQQQPESTEPESPPTESADIPLRSIEADPEESDEEYESASDTKGVSSEFKTKTLPLPTTSSTTDTMSEPPANGLFSPAQLAQLVAAMTAATREVTPANSAFGGTAFEPTGHAAHVAFTPFGEDALARNKDYDKTTKKSGVTPFAFEGNTETFDDWVLSVADKMMEDHETFKTERSRMVIVYNCTTGLAKEMLSTRYGSALNPFKNVAEMIATLGAVYHDNNQAGNARAELSKMMYVGEKQMNISQFISRIGTLADRANIALSERKTILFEHIPPTLNAQLLTDSKDPKISYEIFCDRVTDAAKVREMAFAVREERKKAQGRRSPSPKYTKVVKDVKDHRETKVRVQPTTDAVHEELKKQGLCFICKKGGHIAKDCPDRRYMTAHLKQLEEEDLERDSSLSASSSDAEN